MVYAHVPLFCLLFIALFMYVAGVGDEHVNSKAVVWESAASSISRSSNNPIKYRTQTTYHSEIVEKLNDLSKSSEVVVMFEMSPGVVSNKDSSISLIASLKDLIESSKTATLFPDVQLEDHIKDRKLLSSSLLESPLLSRIKRTNPEELTKFLTGEMRNGFLHNKQVDFFHVQVEKSEDLKVLSKLKNIAGLVCVAIEESSQVQPGKY